MLEDGVEKLGRWPIGWHGLAAADGRHCNRYRSTGYCVCAGNEDVRWLRELHNPHSSSIYISGCLVVRTSILLLHACRTKETKGSKCNMPCICFWTLYKQRCRLAAFNNGLSPSTLDVPILAILFVYLQSWFL